MKTSSIALALLLSLSLGCKSNSDEPATEATPKAAEAATPEAVPAPKTPAPTPGALALVKPAGLDAANAQVVKWLRTAAKCDLHLEGPEADLSLVEQTWGDRWNWDDCAARNTLMDLDLEMDVIDGVLLDALGDDDRNVRLLAIYNLSSSYAKDGKVNELGKLLFAARDEKDPHVGAQLAAAIDHELNEFGRLDDPKKGQPFVLALGDVLARTSNQGLMAETGFSCKLPGCDQLWSTAARDNASPTLRALSHEMARDVLDKEPGCALSAELLAKNDDPVVLQHTADWMSQCEDAFASPKLLARLDALGIESPGAAHLWNALDAIGTDDPKIEAKLSGWAKTIVDKKLGDEEVQGNAKAVLAM